jgi:Uma2 family endonuclease
VLEKLEEYQEAGIPHIWFIDPEHRAFYVYNASGLQRVQAFELPAYGLTIRPADLEL